MSATVTVPQELKDAAQAAQEAAMTATLTLRAAERAASVRSEMRWTPCYDKYGRPSKQLDRIFVAADGRWVDGDHNLAVVVTLPKWVRQENPAESYLLNVRPVRGSGEYRGTVSYHGSLRAAKEAAERAV